MTVAAPGASPGPRSDATRRRILDAAAAALSDHGYAGARLSDIAERASVRPPAIYYYYDSRDALIAEVLGMGQHLVREHVAAALALLPSTANHLDRICTATEAHLRIELELSTYATAVIRNTHHVPSSALDAAQMENDRYQDLWRDLLTEAMADGEIRTDLDLSMARMLVIGALNWAAEWWIDDASLEDLIRTARTMVRRGLAP